MVSRRRLALTITIAMACVFAVVMATNASLLGDVLKVGGVALIVDKFGEQINGFVNKLTLNHDVGVTEATKVVPILSLGSGGYIGAAQVMGDQKNVDQCKAVVQIEGNALFGSSVRPDPSGADSGREEEH